MTQTATRRYSYFDSKNAIDDAMWAQSAQQFVDEQKASMPTPDEPLAALKAAVRFFVEFCAADVARYQLLFQRTIPGFALTPAHDGRIIANVVGEWAGRHGAPFTLALTGPAGGEYVADEDGEHITMDAVEFCRTVSGRAARTGLLTHEVPF